MFLLGDFEDQSGAGETTRRAYAIRATAAVRDGTDVYAASATALDNFEMEFRGSTSSLGHERWWEVTSNEYYLFNVRTAERRAVRVENGCTFGLGASCEILGLDLWGKKVEARADFDWYPRLDDPTRGSFVAKLQVSMTFGPKRR